MRRMRMKKMTCWGRRMTHWRRRRPPRCQLRLARHRARIEAHRPFDSHRPAAAARLRATRHHWLGPSKALVLGRTDKWPSSGAPCPPGSSDWRMFAGRRRLCSLACRGISRAGTQWRSCPRRRGPALWAVRRRRSSLPSDADLIWLLADIGAQDCPSSRRIPSK